jgi:hypothetical protein
MTDIGYIDDDHYVYRLSAPKPDPRIIVEGTVTISAKEVVVSNWTVGAMDLTEFAEVAVRWAEDRLAEAIP